MKGGRAHVTLQSVRPVGQLTADCADMSDCASRKSKEESGPTPQCCVFPLKNRWYRLFEYPFELCWYTGLPLLRLFSGFSIKLYTPSIGGNAAPAKTISEQWQL